MHSMTGYGRRQQSEDGREMTVEVKSVNHRFLDIAFRMQRNLSFLEEPIRKELAAHLARGHVDVFLSYRNLREDAKEAVVDKALARAYQKALDDAAALLGLENDLTLSGYAAMPDVMTAVDKEEDREAVTALALQTLRLALEDLIAMRENEGSAAKKDLSERLLMLEEIKNSIAKKAPEVSGAYREKLSRRLSEAEITQPDPQRLAQEVALFADKCAIDEELSRLESHIAQTRLTLAQPGEVGRKLDFLVQELNREVNTIGSKAADVMITNWVVAAKCEIEKLREQVQNIE